VAYVKLSDDFWSNPKVLAAGDPAVGLYARLLSFCGCHLTDGLIPAVSVDMIVGKNRKGLDALIDARLVDREPTGSLVIHDFLEHNRSKDDWEADKAQRRANGSRGGRPKAGVNGR
jgi:hypothetical protein